MAEKILEDNIYAMQIRDRACTICTHVRKAPQSFCDECGEDKKHWKNAYRVSKKVKEMIKALEAQDE